jgi:hypothetical protein
MPQHLSARKKRKTTSSTIAQRMYAKDAMDSFFAYKVAHKKALFYLVLILAVLGMDFQSEQGQFFGNFFVLAASCYASKVACMLHLDSELMDLHEEDLEDSGYNKDLVDITLTLYINDDECENNTRFSKLKIMTMMHSLGFGDGSGYIRVYYNGPVFTTNLGQLLSSFTCFERCLLQELTKIWLTINLEGHLKDGEKDTIG